MRRFGAVLKKMLDGRVAIVTGAGGGLGRAHAHALAAHGAKVLVSDVNAAQSESVAAEIRNAGGVALGYGCSVTDFEAVQAMARFVCAEWGYIDVLVNNAGILRDKTFAKMSLEDFRLVCEVHLMGSVHCTKAAWDIMRARKYGRIVMTTSSSGLWGSFGQSNYSAAKMALVGLMQTLGLEGEKYGIRVNCLAPTAATQMTNGILDQHLLRDLAPERVSPGVAFLSSDDAPNRVILCAGAGSYERAYITMTRGLHIGYDADAATRLGERFAQLSDRTDDASLPSGHYQSQRETDLLRQAHGS